ncbi:MAG: hypothetical protein AB9869_08380 [Verrucomicrobiia bacterium]
MNCWHFGTILLVGSLFLGGTSILAEQHRATYLGHPATRFAPPLKTKDDLRARFLDAQLRKDMAIVLRQWGWQGDLSDFYRAGLTAEIREAPIPVGSTMPFMSSRKDGRPICLRNVLWAGEKPAPAYAFQFNSTGRRYRCVTPKACSNFFVVDLGPEPNPTLAMICSVPEEVLAARPVQVCLELTNPSEAIEPMTTVSLTIPERATFVRTTGDGAASDGRVIWRIPNLRPTASVQLCAMFAVREPCSLAFNAVASGQKARTVETTCATRVLGVPAILLELIDIEDPVQVGREVTYQVNVTNQGTAPGTNIRVVCKLPPSEEFVSGSGVTPVQAEAGVITAGILAELAPKAVASWQVLVKATRAADARFKVELSSDQFQRPIEEEESTELY